MKKLIVLSLISCLLFLVSCIGNDDDVAIAPKPRAFYRLNFPEKKYKTYDSLCPFTFQTPVLNNDLAKHIEDSRELAVKHQVKASGLDEEVLINDSARVYGLLYDISGNSASAIQFYITDSTKHFLRGSLYFNCPPNIDSLKIVIDYIRTDIMHLIKTFKWKGEPASLRTK
jgi:hypothetical protein